jgi:hypothetical protein
MKTNLRGLLATMFATGLLAACSSDGGNTNPGTDAGVTTDMGPTTDMGVTDGGATDRPATDRPATDRPAVDAGNLVAAACGAAMDISARTPAADGAIHVMGDNTDAPAVQIGNLGLAAMGGCLGATSGGDGSKGGAVVYRYTARTGGVLTVSTANPGTDEFDTVVAVLSACSATATPLACNDDVGSGNLLSTARTSVPLTMGQSVFIVVGGWGAQPKGAATGAFELTVRESAPIAAGMPCPMGSVCATGSICVGATAMNSGVCTADGTAPGAACRTTAPFCDGTFACSVATPSMATRGICRRSAAPGEACGATATCTMMSFCPNFASTAPAGSDAGVSADGGAPAAARYCTLPTMESEPNNTPAAPQAAVTQTTVFRGAITPGTDVDCYAVTVPAGATLYAETSDAQGTCNLGDGEDTVLRIYRQGTAAPIAENDDLAMGTLCSRLDGRTTPALLRVAAGTYSVCVSPYLMMGATEGTPIPAYYLTVGVTPPAP